MFLSTRHKDYGLVRFYYHDYEKGITRKLPILAPGGGHRKAYIIPYNGVLFIIDVTCRHKENALVHHYVLDENAQLSTGNASPIYCSNCILLSQYKTDSTGAAHALIVTPFAYIKITIDHGSSVTYNHIQRRDDGFMQSVCPYDEILDRFCIISRSCSFNCLYVDLLDDECNQVERVALDGLRFEDYINSISVGDGMLHVSTSLSGVKTFDLRTGHETMTYTDESDGLAPKRTDVSWVTECVYMLRMCNDTSVVKYVHYPTGIGYTVQVNAM